MICDGYNRCRLIGSEASRRGCKKNEHRLKSVWGAQRVARFEEKE